MFACVLGVGRDGRVELFHCGEEDRGCGAGGQQNAGPDGEREKMDRRGDRSGRGHG